MMIFKCAVDADILYDNHNFITKKYMVDNLKACVDLGEVKEGDTVLDFGCNNRFLKEYLPCGVKYVGYDIIPGFSDVKDYKKVKPDVVLTSHVLEHLNEEQIDEFVVYILKVKPRVLSVVLPLENTISKIATLAMGMYWQRQIIHYTKWFDILRKLNAHFDNTKLVTVWFMSIATQWKAKEKKRGELYNEKER